MASTPGFSLQVTIYINPKDVERWFELFKPVFDHVIAEPECRFFELYQSFDDPGTISWVENWAGTVDWFWDVQIKKEYYKEYLEATEPMFIKPREVKFVKPVGAPYSVCKGDK